MKSEFLHTTVMQEELVDALNLQYGDLAVDCTAGGGGHTSLMLEKVSSQGKIFAFDRDLQAINALKGRFKAELNAGQLTLIHGPFSSLGDKLETNQGLISGICMDLGVSSPQIDIATRGFSFSQDGPLDMRMSPESQKISAADVIADFEAEALERIFYEFGEEPKTRYIVSAITEQRALKRIETTHELANIVKNAVHYKKNSRKHPATKVFQALRIYVNQELHEVTKGLDCAFNLLKPGGRLAAISFHSLEDRIVKHYFKEKAGKITDKSIPRDLPLTDQELSKSRLIEGKIIKPFPISPKETEIEQNPRARSAKLRILVKI